MKKPKHDTEIVGDYLKCAKYIKEKYNLEEDYLDKIDFCNGFAFASSWLEDDTEFTLKLSSTFPEVTLWHVAW